MLNHKYVLNESIQGTVGDFCRLKGIDTDQFVEFLQANFDWARHCEAYTMVDFDCLERCFSRLNEATEKKGASMSKLNYGYVLNEGTPPKWKQQSYIKDPTDASEIFDKMSLL